MPLYYRNLTIWDGERVNGVRHPREIEWDFTQEQLTRIGLYRPIAPASIPAGKEIDEAPGQVQFVDDVLFYKLKNIAPPPAPEIISRRQFFQACAVAGQITEAEALAAVRVGAIPAAFQAFIDAMPEAQRFGATMLISGATDFDLNSPLAVAFVASRGMSDSDRAALWRVGGGL